MKILKLFITALVLASCTNGNDNSLKMLEVFFVRDVNNASHAFINDKPVDNHYNNYIAGSRLLRIDNSIFYLTGKSFYQIKEDEIRKTKIKEKKINSLYVYDNKIYMNDLVYDHATDEFVYNSKITDKKTNYLYIERIVDKKVYYHSYDYEYSKHVGIPFKFFLSQTEGYDSCSELAVWYDTVYVTSDDKVYIFGESRNVLYEYIPGLPIGSFAEGRIIKFFDDKNKNDEEVFISEIIVEKDIIIYKWNYGNQLYLLDMRSDEEKVVTLESEITGNFNVYKKMIYIPTEKGLYKYNIESAELVKILDKQVNYVAILDERWVYVEGIDSNGENRIMRIEQES